LNEHFIFVVIAFWLGAIWGSFANVVIVRLPKNENVAVPRSHCPQCKALIPWYLNVPIVSWFLLRGRCKNCRTPISFRYPLVEFIMGLLFAAIFYRYAWSFSTLEYLIFTFFVVTASFIDLDHMILPDQITLTGILIGLFGAAVNPERAFLDAFLGVLVGGGFLLAIAYLYFAFRKIEGMGGGDIKLLGWIGAVCGLQSIMFVILASSLLGLVIGGTYLLVTKGGMKTGIPFGPYLALAALLYIIFDVSVVMQLFIPLPS
jgi:leader peptidase (prepilin peptidase)/N-methyltransferase